jgi:hypothetical protein
MKSLVLLTLAVSSLRALAAAPSSERVYSILQQNGVYVECSSTTAGCINRLELSKIQCVQRDGSKDTDCSYVDSARPKETGNLTGNTAAEMFATMISSGAKAIHLFGETEITLSILRCEKVFSSAAECSTLKPLL